jgi:dolichol-phosphate mannosyltransferase
MKACVVVPTYNEKENVAPMVDGVKAVGITGLDLLCVDDSSPDGTADVVRRISTREPWVHLMVREAKKGIGSAYQDGFRHALKSLAPDVLVEMDADLQHPPSVLREILAAIDEGADVVIASRYVQGGGTVGWGTGRRMVSRGANALVRLLLGLQVRDCTSGFRGYTRAAAEKVVKASLPAKGFEFQVATLHLLKTHARIVEVPFTFTSRKVGKSKLGFADLARFLFSIVRMSMG